MFFRKLAERPKLSFSRSTAAELGPDDLAHLCWLSEEEDANLPVASFLGVEVLRQVIIGVEPEVEPGNGEGVDPSHSSI